MNPDVIIIGAGVIGCATAFELSKAGYRTLNIDKNSQPGAGSTINSCAIVRLGYSTFDGIALAWEGFQYWKDWENYLGMRDERGFAQFVNHGTVMMLSPEPRLQRMMALFERLQIPFDVWDTPTAQARLPFISTGSFHPPTRLDDDRFWAEPEGEIGGAIYIHEGGYITDPQLATHNLMVAAQARGATFLFGRSVVDIRKSAGRVAGVTLDNGEQMDAPIVINISGPHSGVINQMAGVLADMNIRTRPLRHEVHFVPAPSVQIARRASHYSDSDSGVYFRPETGDTLLVGSKDPECDPREWVENPDEFNREVTDHQYKLQVYRLAKRLPNLQIPAQPRGIVDLYDVSDDWLPIYDKSSLPGFYMAVGTSGNQFKNAAPVGYMMAQLIHAVENGHDHDAEPVQYPAVYTKLQINTGFYSRLRQINQESSFSVSG